LIEFIRVGGATNTTRVAVEEGVCPAGGIALLLGIPSLANLSTTIRRPALTPCGAPS